MASEKQAGGLCYHCDLPVPHGDPFRAELNGKERSFCCPACLAVASTIVGAGLGAFYRYQQNSAQQADTSLLEDNFSAFDDSIFQQAFVTQQGDNNSCRLLINGIHCAACIWLLENQLQKLPGVTKANVSFAEQKATVSYDPRQLKLSEICQAIARIGYNPEPYRQEQLLTLQKQESHKALRQLGVAGIGMMQVGMFAIALYAGDMQSITHEYRDLMRWTSWLVATVVMVYSSQVFFIGAWRGLKQHKPGMDLPVAIAIGLAYTASLKATLLGTGEVYFDSVTMFTFLLLGGRYLEMRARHYSGRLSTDLHSLLPTRATRLEQEDGSEVQRSQPLVNIRPGDRLWVKPGEAIPADGYLESGASNVNEAQLTGEFAPQAKQSGDALVAGTINISNPFTMVVERTGADLQIQAISELLSEAQSHKPQIALLADKLSRYFIIVVLSMTVLTYIAWQWVDPSRAFWVMLSVLVVSCPCALALATPTALTAATNRLRQSGLLVADAQMWEKIPAITDVVCDKTGTLTKGHLSVQQVVTLTPLNREQCLNVAAMLEAGSEHPIAKAFQVAGSQVARDIVTDIGQGVSGFVGAQRYYLGQPSYACAAAGINAPEQPNPGHWVLLADTQQALAWFLLNDETRDDAASLVQSLQQQGIKVHMLSGDSSGSAEQLSHQLGISHCRSSATPEQKLQYIAALQQQGAKVLMVGDGINDIPVLAAADTSVAMTNASDLAKTHADGILLSGQLSGITEMMALSLRTKRTIKQNLAWSLLYNFSAIPLAAQGLIPPYLAAIGMSLSSLLVLLNALRLQRWRPQTPPQRSH